MIAYFNKYANQLVKRKKKEKKEREKRKRKI